MFVFCPVALGLLVRWTVALVCKQAFLLCLGVAGGGGLIAQNVAVVCNSPFSIGLGLLVVWNAALAGNASLLPPIGVASRAECCFAV